MQPSAFKKEDFKEIASKETVDGSIDNAKNWIAKVKPYAERGQAPPIGQYGLVDLNNKGKIALLQTCIVECV